MHGVRCNFFKKQDLVKLKNYLVKFHSQYILNFCYRKPAYLCEKCLQMTWDKLLGVGFLVGILTGSGILPTTKPRVIFLGVGGQ